MSSGREHYQQRLLDALEKLLAIPSANLRVALSHASDVVAAALPGTDKVDAFLYDPSRDSLVALGTSSQPLSELQRNHGLDVLPLSNGGRVVHVFQTGEPFMTGRLDQDPEELKGVKEALEIRSKLGVPLVVNGRRRGMMMIASQTADQWSSEDMRFASSVARWVGVIAHHAELVEEIARNSVEQGRRALAHDLRNYLQPIQLRLSLLRRRAEGDGRESDQRDIDASLKGLAQLSGLVSNILDVARIDQGMFPIHVGPVDIVELLHEIALPLSTPEHPVHVKAFEHVVVLADAARARQCLENLLANALKHSPEGASVTVEVLRDLGPSGSWAIIDVMDEGPGISPEVMPHLFERFVTGQSDKGGLGLGLYLAKRIAVLHGGDLTVESTPGKGARFKLTLPTLE